MTALCYSPHPHEHYLKNGSGPGSLFVGDTAMWNWRWLRLGEADNAVADSTIATSFNNAIRSVMEMTPADAYLWLGEHAPHIFHEKMKERLVDAQARLFPPVVKSREGNLVVVNFRRQRAA